MARTDWQFEGLELLTCNCDWGCPCQFNARPTHGDCRAAGALRISTGRFDGTALDGVVFAWLFAWPGAIHEGRGECFYVIDTRATPEQRDALLRILRGQDTEPFATVFSVFASTCEKEHEPIVAAIDFDLDLDGRKARAIIDGVLEMKGEPIVNPVSGAEHRVRIVQPNGFEFAEAEIGRGWSKSEGPVAYILSDTYGQFAHIHLCQSGMVRA